MLSCQSNDTIESRQPAEVSRLKVVVLLHGQPQAPELWALKRLASVPVTLDVVRALKGRSVSIRKRMKNLIREYGLGVTVSRLLGSHLIAPMYERRERERVDRLFDGEHLREWWRLSGIEPVAVPHLNHPAAQTVIRDLRPDIIVRLSGGILKRETFSLARIVTLNIHHGMAPRIRGMWSIPWGIIERRDDWIGATVHEIDDGIDTGRVCWRGAPQIAPGDTGTTVAFRAHLEAVEALLFAIGEYGAGRLPAAWPRDDREPSVYRTAPGIGGWLRYLYLGRGRHSSLILDRAWKTEG